MSSVCISKGTSILHYIIILTGICKNIIDKIKIMIVYRM
jgi:hypothetical protein